VGPRAPLALIVPADAAGERLDVFLAPHVGSRAAAQRVIDEGRVTVDGAHRAKRRVVQAGEAVRVEPAGESTAEPVAPARFALVHEDEHLLVVDKPPGVVVHPSPGHGEGTLVQALAGRVAGGSDPTRPGLVHRLDQDTSGLLVLARSEPVHAALSAALAAREITREYLALVDGRPPARRGTIDAPLGRDRTARTRVSTDTEEGRRAVTHFVLEEALPQATLLRVRLETGRTHQIRAHMLAIEHPILGDRDYGVAGYGLARQFLHATRLAFEHPVSREAIDATSPLPRDLAAALARARRLE